jgi:hypothetical protein
MTAVIVDQRVVTDTIIDTVRDLDVQVGDGFAPLDAGQQYVVIQCMSGAPLGGMRPNRSVWWTYRFRFVGVDRSVASSRLGPRMDAQAIATKVRRHLLDHAVVIAGDGWRIGGRRWHPNGDENEGRTSNVIDDIEFLVSPANT